MNFEQLLRFFVYGRGSGRAGPYRIEYLGWGVTAIVDEDDNVYLLRDSDSDDAIVYFTYSVNEGMAGEEVTNAMWNAADYEYEGHVELSQAEGIGDVDVLLGDDAHVEVLD